ncbi:MAG: DsbA family protein [Rhodospirillales bacterium]|nr:DsbA family protein [Alphaproteobacteria bacterium]MCB9986443.1 DsbA family protein [Rhodospirillales bacterium]USO07011.1 MAG: DsbA family protein [Rhodospirillales bacterium]
MRRLLLAFAFLMPLTPMMIAAARAEEFTRTQIESIIHDYIANHPKEMIDSVENYGKQQQMVEDQQASTLVQENMDWLVHNSKHAEAGSTKPDASIVEFFDYNCGYCKAALPDLMTLLGTDKNLRIVFVEIPILGESSITAAKWALAANEQGKYLPYHILLMKHKGPLDEATLVDYAKRAGLDADKLKADKDSDKIARIIDENIGMARKLGIQGTPAFVVGDQLLRGYVGMDALRDALKTAREAEKK